MLEKTDAKARTKHKDINKLLSATVKEWHVLPSKDFAKLKAMSKDSVLRENPSGKQNDNAPLHELISLFIAQLSQEQCAHILKEFGVAITDFDTDFKKRLAELFMETLQDGYKEYKLIENNVEKEEDDDD